METQVLKIEDPIRCRQEMSEAARRIRRGEVVAFPTETVYGLGANALDGKAVKGIFEAKGRPGDNPLIVHIESIVQWDVLVTGIPEKARILAKAFWPGPMTMILKKTGKIPDVVSAGLDTVGVRMPSHPVARELIRLSGVPIAAPSANRSGRPSPTEAKHVLEDMNGRIPLILDGGKANVGVESTVLDMTGEMPVILRPGGVTPEMLEKVIGPVQVDPHVMKPIADGQQVKSPGMKYRHYAPNAPVTIVRGDPDKLARYVEQEVHRLQADGERIGILATDETMGQYTAGIVRTMGSRKHPAQLAASLFALLREMDHLGVDRILAEGVEDHDEGLAVMNRMTRAAGFHIIDV